MDATALLCREHDRLRRSVEALASATGARERAAALQRVRSELRAHELLEETVFYPAVRRVRSRQLRGAVRDGLEQHHAIDGLLVELSAVDVDDAAFGARAGALREAVTAHLQGEEAVLFTEARLRLAEVRLERLGRRMESLRREPEAVTAGG